MNIDFDSNICVPSLFWVKIRLFLQCWEWSTKWMLQLSFVPDWQQSGLHWHTVSTRHQSASLASERLLASGFVAMQRHHFNLNNMSVPCCFRMCCAVHLAAPSACVHGSCGTIVHLLALLSCILQSWIEHFCLAKKKTADVSSPNEQCHHGQELINDTSSPSNRQTTRGEIQQQHLNKETFLL